MAKIDATMAPPCHRSLLQPSRTLMSAKSHRIETRQNCPIFTLCSPQTRSMRTLNLATAVMLFTGQLPMRIDTAWLSTSSLQSLGRELLRSRVNTPSSALMALCRPMILIRDGSETAGSLPQLPLWLMCQAASRTPSSTMTMN